MSNIRTYDELTKFETFEERFKYLKLDGSVGKDTFGFDRYLNQNFYRSKEWKDVRNHVIARDLGRDLGVEGREIFDKVLIHHMNPITANDIIEKTDFLLNPNYLISTSKSTHDAIHYGDFNPLFSSYTKRCKGDTKLW